MTQYEILKQYFGYDTFREGQDVLIESILNGRDVLGVAYRRGKVPVLSNPRSYDGRNYAGYLPSHLSDEGSGEQSESGGHTGRIY